MCNRLHQHSVRERGRKRRKRRRERGGGEEEEERERVGGGGRMSANRLLHTVTPSHPHTVPLTCSSSLSHCRLRVRNLFSSEADSSPASSFNC